MKALGIEPGDVEPKATENIPEMIAHIQGLIDKKHAYAIDGMSILMCVLLPLTVNYPAKALIKCLKLCVLRKVLKKTNLILLLWKASKPGDPTWDSLGSRADQSWHIECSCMSMKHLHTQTLDIHAGGRDLISFSSP